MSGEDLTPVPERPGCPECAPGAADPHDEPDRAHVHLTGYGYLIYAPDREHRDFIEEIRAFERRAGREEAARDVELALIGMNGVMVNRMFVAGAAGIARGQQPAGEQR